ALVTYVAALFEHDEAKAMTELDKIFAEGKNMLRFTEDLLAYLRDLLLDKNSQYDRGQIFSWIDVAIESLKTIKETTQTKIAADVMTMRLAEIGQNNLLTASQGEIPNQLTAEIATLKTEINQLKAQISAGQIQVNSDSQNNLLTENVKASPKPIASKKRQINKDLIYKALAEATNEARKAALSAWPELVASVTKPADRALLNNTAPVAASENFLVVTFPHENLAKRVSENEELQLFCGNLLSSIVGFAPEIISLAEQDWQEVRAEYVSNLKSENVQEDEEDEKEPDETVNLAKELFGEKVVEIND
ncbi:DNA polymerase III subunit gamma/tau, partial [Lactococcus lactis]